MHGGVTISPMALDRCIAGDAVRGRSDRSSSDLNLRQRSVVRLLSLSQAPGQLVCSSHLGGGKPVASSFPTGDATPCEPTNLQHEINSPMLLIDDSSTPKKKQSFSQVQREKIGYGERVAVAVVGWV
ncbi:uncharacterized protein [Triticum aestivum]|uniref:uncharacterized protein n=1 Tax=Triticum aestivum TaxID=4565 RepID=UPI000989D44A|nr:uncharacterized protein LOC109740638 [Aegilops tauschii subsp. strangulata]XP_044416633.1 uncharacterized protein LOC123141597 [Triticum aestivum]